MSSPLGAHVARSHARGRLVVQPRMGFGDARRMRQGLVAVKALPAATVGTITLDSFTRVNDHAGARRQLIAGEELNGYPLVAHGAAGTRALLDGVIDDGFPVQVRHGSADPRAIFETMCAAGLQASEGGPISYCLPYGRTPLRDAVRAWTEATRQLATDPAAHLETFGGCLLGQLCPPGLLVAVSLLEALFFRSLDIASVSLSYAQQTNPEQDREAVAALRALARRHLGDVDWHVVVYTYMGRYPATATGADALLDESVRLAVESGAERLIVKTTAEAIRIPTVAENLRALERATALADTVRPRPQAGTATAVHAEAQALIEAVLALDARLDVALQQAFARGLLDVPYCLHPDNHNQARAVIAADGRLEWADTGRMPLPERRRAARDVDARDLLAMLDYVAARHDAPELPR